MSAKEMFEELGYELVQGLEQLGYQKEIYENKYSKTVAMYKHIDFDKKGKEIYCSCITLDELKAINQQCKELGWID